MQEDTEFSPLTGRRTATPSRIPWLIFGSTSFATIKKLHTGVANNFYDHQGGLIEQQYPLHASSASFEAGTVLSFCDGQSSVCPGLGPRWNQTLIPPPAWTAAIAAQLVQLSGDLAVYAWSPSYPLNVLNVVAIRTSSTPPAYTSPIVASISLSDPIDHLVLKAYNDHSFVIAYDTYNASFLIGGTATASSAVQLGAPVNMSDIPASNDDFEIDLVVLQAQWILVSYGQNLVGASFLAYTLSENTLTPITVVDDGYAYQIVNHIASVDLGSNYFLQATGNLAILAKYSFSANALTLTSVTVLTYPGHVIYRHVGALTLFNGLISLYGVQIDNLDVPLTISILLKWSTSAPYIVAYYPSNLLENQQHQPQDLHISACYIPGPNEKANGELFFTYVDMASDRAKLIRAQFITNSNSEVQILPSLPVDISTFKYSTQSPTAGPLISCPSSAGVLMAYQYGGTYFNSFAWVGGYRFAGVVQESYDASSSKTGVKVLRQGISTVHTGLQAGHGYYVHTTGRLEVQGSLLEMFTPSPFASRRLATALSPSALLLEPAVFDAIIPP